jgi:hypothetical protein
VTTAELKRRITRSRRWALDCISGTGEPDAVLKAREVIR